MAPLSVQLSVLWTPTRALAREVAAARAAKSPLMAAAASRSLASFFVRLEVAWVGAWRRFFESQKFAVGVSIGLHCGIILVRLGFWMFQLSRTLQYMRSDIPTLSSESRVLALLIHPKSLPTLAKSEAQYLHPGLDQGHAVGDEQTQPRCLTEGMAQLCSMQPQLRKP